MRVASTNRSGCCFKTSSTLPYLPSTVLLAKSLPPKCRTEYMEWISAVKLEKRTRTGRALDDTAVQFLCRSLQRPCQRREKMENKARSQASPPKTKTGSPMEQSAKQLLYMEATASLAHTRPARGRTQGIHWPGSYVRIPFSKNETGEDAARKGSFRRATQRATHSENQSTWCRGRFLSPKQLADKATQEHSPLGTTGQKREVTQWLCDGRDQGRPEHILVLQETAWKFDMNCTTSSATTRGPRWHVLRSGSGTPEGGVLFFILTTLFRTEQIRSAVLHGGRLFHVRIMMDPPLDVIGIYQHTWNVQKKPLQEDPAEQPGGSKTEQLLQRRRKIWKQLRTWISDIPRRNGCIIMGDFNTPVLPVPALVGEGLAKTWSPCCSNRSL